MNLNAKYFLISQRRGRYHQNKFLKISPKETMGVKDRPFILTSRHGLKTSGILLIIWFDRSSYFFLHYLILFWFKRYTLVIKILDLINKELCTTVLF